MENLDAEAIRSRSRDWTPLVEAADAALIALATGRCDAPLRTALPLVAGSLLTMPGRMHGSDTAIVKLVSVVPENSSRGLPTINGLAVVFDAQTGQPRALLDGSQLTALVGSGAQAAWQARALVDQMRADELLIWSPTPVHKERLAAQLAGGLPCTVRTADSLQHATESADLICCATTAPSAFLEASMMPSSSAVIAIGAYRSDMAEIGVSVFRAAGRVYVDDREAVMHEAGDVIAAIQQGAIRPNQVLPIGSFEPSGVPTDRPSIFKSVGSAVEDLAVATALLASSP
jgi:ornithine cyclodeaminase/alanine dehydrogenase-like protein (mu-crystallin family)